MSQEKIQQMQFLEQNLQNLIYQKQSLQMELSETQSAVKELESGGDEVYKIVGQLMLKTEKEKTKKELQEKEKTINSRLSSIEKQEKTINDKLEQLRGEILGENKKENKDEEGKDNN